MRIARSIHAARVVAPLLWILPFLAACSTGPTATAGIPEVEFERETHPNAKLLEVAEQIPGFGGGFFNDQGRLTVYMPDPRSISAEARAALAEAFSVGPETIRFVEGQYAISQLARWYYDDGVAAMGDHAEVVGALLWGAGNRLVLFLDAFRWEAAHPDEHPYRARVQDTDAQIERLEALLEELEVPLDAVVLRASGGLADDGWAGTERMLPPPLTSPYAWPEEFRTALDDETLVLFTWPHPAVDWEPSAIVLHVPSGSRGTVRWWWPDDQLLVNLRDDHGSGEGRAHVASFLNDEAVLQRMEEGIKEIWKQAPWLQDRR